MTDAAIKRLMMCRAGIGNAGTRNGDAMTDAFWNMVIVTLAFAISVVLLELGSIASSLRVLAGR